MGEALSDQEPGSGSTRLIHFATITARVDAFVLRSALEHEGVYVWMGAEYHAGADPISHALGGYRLEIFEADWEHASALARELAWPEAEIVYAGQKHAVQRLLALFYGLLVFFGIPGLIQGAVSVWWFLLMAINIPTILPVDPRGQNDFRLMESREG